jgi:hypothetical protein
MRASLRESRMVVERLCQSVGIQDGILRSITDCGVFSVALGLAGFAEIERHLELLHDVAPEKMSASAGGGRILLDAGGQHSWVVAEPALDLLVAAHRVTGEREISIDNLVEPAEIQVMGALAQKHGLDAEIQPQSDGRIVARLVDRTPGEPTVLDRIVREGIAVSRELWFHLFHRSHDALAPDTVLSRTHTGSIIVKPDGTIIGKEDPEFIDTDLSLLTRETVENYLSSPTSAERSTGAGNTA